MLKNSLRLARSYATPKAIVLMYHRIATVEADAWDLAVTPTHFEEQLRVLQRMGNVITADELVAGLRRRHLKRRSLVLTFDDGYEDNFLIAKPLLEKYRLPATFFIITGALEERQPFWSDELLELFTCASPLPTSFSLLVADCQCDFNLTAEQFLSADLRQQHRHWKAVSQAPPTARTALYYRLWQLLKPLPHAQQQQELRRIRAWAGASPAGSPEPTSLSRTQVQELSNESLFTIGAHTRTHPALSGHPLAFQQQELLKSQHDLAQLLGRDAPLLAYPYGDCNSATITLASKIFQAAFTTAERPVTNHTDPYQIGRFPVKNWTGDAFRHHLQGWLK